MKLHRIRLWLRGRTVEKKEKAKRKKRKEKRAKTTSEHHNQLQPGRPYDEASADNP